MSDYAAPSGPPPPRVPDGWKAVWNSEYKEWFYVNIHTKQSTWDKPTAPAPHGDDDSAPSGPPPGYSSGPGAPTAGDVKKPLDSNNPYNSNRGPGGHETDEEMARRLQREEDTRARGPSHSPRPGERGAADSYYNSGAGVGAGSTLSPQQQQTYPTSPGSSGATGQRGSGGGFFGKLKDKFGGPGGSSQYPPRPAGYGQQPYMGNQGGGYGGPPQGYQQGGYGGYPQGPYQQGPYQQGPYQQGPYQQGYQQQYVQQPQKKHGLGTAGAAALGVGGGLLGGMLLEDAIQDHDQNEYDQGFDQGYDDGGGDFGGGDF